MNKLGSILMRLIYAMLLLVISGIGIGILANMYSISGTLSCGDQILFCFLLLALSGAGVWIVSLVFDNFD